MIRHQIPNSTADGTCAHQNTGNHFCDQFRIAEADAHSLAEKIEQEWFDSYRLAMQNMYDPDAILPEDLYVFDTSMKWCVVFTHETTDWESELDDPMKAAESRICIICKD